jgi:hypothetical protein
LEEFNAVVSRGVSGGSIGGFSPDTAMVRHFFGADGKDKLDFAAFRKVMSALEEQILRSEFVQYALAPADGSNGPPTMSPQQLLSYLDAHSQQIPPHVRENLFKLSGGKGGSAVTFEAFRALHSFLRDIDSIEDTLQRTMQAAGGSKATAELTREQFVAALTKAKQGTAPDPLEVEVVMRIFGTPAGTIDQNAFVRVMHSTAQYTAQQQTSSSPLLVCRMLTVCCCAVLLCCGAFSVGAQQSDGSPP